MRSALLSRRSEETFAQRANEFASGEQACPLSPLP